MSHGVSTYALRQTPRGQDEEHIWCYAATIPMSIVVVELGKNLNASCFGD